MRPEGAPRGGIPRGVRGGLRQLDPGIRHVVQAQAHVLRQAATKESLTAAGCPAAGEPQSGSRETMAARISVAVSPAKALRPVSIS